MSRLSAPALLASVLFALFLCLLPAAAQNAATDAESDAPAAEPARPAIARLAVCENVEERAPVGEADAFPSDVGKLSCFTKVVGAGNPTRIFHRWYVGDTLVDEIPISVKSSSWRCWSNKTILSAWSGPCRVEILTESGDVLGTKEFRLTAAPPDDSSDGE